MDQENVKKKTTQSLTKLHKTTENYKKPKIAF